MILIEDESSIYNVNSCLKLLEYKEKVFHSDLLNNFQSKDEKYKKGFHIACFTPFTLKAWWAVLCPPLSYSMLINFVSKTTVNGKLTESVSYESVKV